LVLPLSELAEKMCKSSGQNGNFFHPSATFSGIGKNNGNFPIYLDALLHLRLKAATAAP